MMLEEFEARTGYYPSSETYRVIEEEYVQFDGDKDAFCKAFKLNTNGLATRIQRTLNSQRWQKIREAEAEKAALKKQIEELQKKLDHELEWQPYEMKENTRQADYDHLGAAGRVMTDDEAKDLLYDWFGFAREKVTILHSVPTYEINRHGQLRRTGETERLPTLRGDRLELHPLRLRLHDLRALQRPDRSVCTLKTKEDTHGQGTEQSI